MVKVAKDPRSLLMYVLTLLQLAIAVVIIVVVKKLLWEYDMFSAPWTFPSVDPDLYKCMITYNAINLCAYMYIVLMFSMIQSVVVFFTTLSGKRIWRGIEVLVLGFGLLWWIPAAATTNIYGRRSDDRGLPEKGARTAVWSLSWAEVALFAIALIVTVADCLRPRKKRRPMEAPDEEEEQLEPEEVSPLVKQFCSPEGPPPALEMADRPPSNGSSGGDRPVAMV